MPPLLPRVEPGDDPDARDPRVESPCAPIPSHALLLRPLTSEPRLGQRRPSLHDDATNLDAAMPSIFPAPLSVPGTKPTPTRRTFLPQLTHAKTFAERSLSPGDSGAKDDDDPSLAADEDTEDFKRAMWAGQANILVAVRVRPHCVHDRDAQEIVRVLDHKLIVVLDKHQQTSGSASSPVRSVEPVPASVALQQPRRSSGSVAHAGHGLRKLRNVASAHPGRIAGGIKGVLNNNNNNTSHATSSNQNGASRSREKRYAFDYVFTPQDGQQTVYRHTTKFLIHGVLNGFNATVFAYGCTGAGKTYTMLGTPDEPGIMALTLDDLFQNIAKVHADPQATVEYKVTVSFLEVYNENIRDLLVTPPPFGTAMSSPAGAEFLDLREDPVKGPVVAGISEVEASNAQEVMKLLRRGNKHRSQEATAANAVSSRSHAVLQVLVEQREKTSSSESFGLDAERGGTMTSTAKYGKLSLVDLAGSERAAVTQNRGQRLIEGANINRSLLALGNCINALGEKGAGAANGGFVPYRDSKLTRLLKDSLGGNCRTVMIANVSPASASMEETLNTLKYANRAKNIKTTVTRNVLQVEHHLTEYAGVVAHLKDEIAMLRKQLVQQPGTTAAAPASSPRLFGNRTSPGRADKERRAMDANNDEGQDSEDAWKHAKLAEARGYIVQCFEQRQQLRRNLLNIDHCIDELTRQLKQITTGRPEAPETMNGADNGKKISNERQRDLATSILEDIVGDSSYYQQSDSAVNGETPVAQYERLEAGIRQLLARKTQIVAQLERNQSVMDDFRTGIEQSTLFVTNELLRDVLLMEYRVGDLQVENAVYSVKQALQEHQVALLRARLSGQNAQDATSLEASYLCKALGEMPSLELPAPFTEMTRLLSANQSQRDAEETPEVHSTRSSTGFAFLDDLRDRFYKPPQQSTRPPQHEHKSVSGTGGVSSGLSPRRQWGIHLNNTTLPYIRLKKKSTPPAVIEAVSTKSPTPSDYASSTDDPIGQSRAPGSTGTAAPYLKVLKHRRKLQHRSSLSGSSHKKLPGIQPSAS